MMFTTGSIKADDSNCRDIAMVFARGSGQNPDNLYTDDTQGDDFRRVEPEAYHFFDWQKQYITKHYPHVSFKAVSIHDFPGKYDPVGFKSVSVFPQVDNLSNAEVSWIPGDYRDSVDHGIAETVGYLKDQIATCPDQGIIIGGYSQGAQVVGDALFQLTQEERDRILGVGLFGDPKYTGAYQANFFSTPVSQPWRRGSASELEFGMLDRRVPYVPKDIELRVTSNCSRYDIICAGWSAANVNFRQVHSGYWQEPVRQSTVELMRIASPHLAAAERAKGGLSSEPGVKAVSAEDKQRKRDILFLMNDNSNLEVLQTFRYYLDPLLYHFTAQFNQTRYGAKAFAEHDYGFSAPRVDTIQSFLPYSGYQPGNPSFSSSNLSRAFAARYPFGQTIIGGGDSRDPYQIALERSIVSTAWDPDVEKNIILIVDRPPKDPYTYNICNGTVRRWLHYPDSDGYNNCYANYRQESWQKVLVPEACETVLLVMTQDLCESPLKSPSIFQNNTRTLRDSIVLAQANNVKISVVIPNRMDNPYGGINQQADRDILRDLAYSTGGTYLYYDQITKFNTATLGDMLQQVFTKEPHSLVLQSSNGDTMTDSQVINATAGTLLTLDVSQSELKTDNYKWDFNDDGTWDETTTSPVTTHTFSEPATTIVRVQAQDSTGNAVAETRRAVVVAPRPVTDLPAISTRVPTVVAQANQDGSISVSWQSDESGELVIIDPATALPIASVPLGLGTVQIAAPAPYQELVLRVISQDGASPAVTVSVQPFVTPDEISSVQEDTETCYKLQQCNTESAPEVNSTTAVLQGPGSIIVPASYVTRGPSTSPAQSVENGNQATSPQVAGISSQQSASTTPASTLAFSPDPASQHSFWKYLLALFLCLITAAALLLRYAFDSPVKSQNQ